MNRITTVGLVVPLLGRKFRHAWLSREWRAFVVAICLLATAKPVAAITFNLNFVAGANNPNDPTGSGVMSIMQEAANRWADIIEDNHTMTLNVSYYVNDAMGNGPCGISTALACAGIVSANAAQNRTVVGNVRVRADANWYIDPTPSGDTEFDFTQTLHRDLTLAQQTAGYSGLDVEPLLEVGFRGANNTSDPNVASNFDMLGVALHEIGHHLGVTSQLQAAQDETADDDYDLPSTLLAGANMSVEALPGNEAHFVDAFPLMRTTISTGTRPLPSAVDVLAAAAVSVWSQIDLPRKDFLTGAVWGGPNNWEGNRVPNSQDDAFVRHGGAVAITANAGVANLLVGDSSQLLVRATVHADEIRIASSATMTVGIGGAVANTASFVGFDGGAGTLTIEDGGELSSTFGQVATGEGSDGAVTVTGAGSTWTNSSTLHVGYDGTGSLTISSGGAVSNTTARLGFRAGSDGAVTVTGAGSTWTNSSTLHVGNFGIGSLIISAGGAVSAVDGRVGSFAGSEGAVIVTGAGSTWTTSSLSVGGTPTLSGGTGTLDVLSGGLVQASGNTVVWNNGDIDLRAGGTLNANGNVTIDGGALTRDSAGTFSLAAAKTMTVQNGGTATFSGSYNTASNAIYNIAGSGSRLEAVTGGTLSIINGAQVNVSSGGSLFAATTIQVGFSNDTDGTLIVDGTGSSATTPGIGASIWGFGGATATVTFQNNASGSFSQVSLAHSTTAGTAGDVVIQSGADLTFTSNLALAALGGATTSATLSVQGSGSTVTQTGGSALTVGHSATGKAAINIGTISSGAVFDTGTGLTTISKTGTVTIGSGANTGTLNADGNVTINGGVLTRGSGSLFDLADGKTMTVTGGGRASFTGSYTSPSNAIYNVSGANSKLESINNNLSINSGSQLNVSSGGLVSAVGVNVGTSGAGTLTVDGSGSAVTAIGSSFWGHSNATSNVTFRNGATGTLAELRLANDPIANDVVVVNTESGADLSVGSLSLAVFGGGSNATLNVNGSGSSVTQTGGSTLTVGHASSGLAAINVGTTNSSGLLTTGTGLTTINKTGTLTVGSGANAGTFNANGNVTINGGLLQVDTTSRVIVSPAKSMTLVNAGTLKGSGSVSGAVVNVSGVVSPGTSPGTLSIDGNYTQDAAGQLLIELASASSFDRLVSTDFISLAGTLDVRLLGGFIPQPGAAFQIISASNVVAGTFASVLLPTLTGANWQLLYGPNSVSLQVTLAGDYNFDGAVDTADYVVWRKGIGVAPTPANYELWRANFGRTTGAGASAPGSAGGSSDAVPEPASLALFLVAAAHTLIPRHWGVAKNRC